MISVHSVATYITAVTAVIEGQLYSVTSILIAAITSELVT